MHKFDFAVKTSKMATEAEGGTSIVRRNRPGTKAKDMYSWPDQDFNDMETVLAGKSFMARGTELCFTSL